MLLPDDNDLKRSLQESNASELKTSQPLAASDSTPSASTIDSSINSTKLPSEPALTSNPYNDKLSPAKSTTKKKNKSFFAKLRGNTRQEEDDDAEQGRDREEGCNANVFGYLANFPTPPKYIWVRAHKKKQREFNHLFFAQELKCKLKPGSAASKATTWCARFSLDGKYLATAGADYIVRVWQVISTPEEREFYNEEANADGDDSWRGSRRGSMRRGSKPSTVSAPVFFPYPIREYVGHTQDVLDLSWSKNNFLLSSSMDKTVHLWHLKMPTSIVSFMHSDFVTSIAFHPKDDRFFLSGSLDCKLRLWSIPEKKVAYTSRAPDLIMAVAFTPDGSTAIAGCFGGQCLFYETDGLTLNNQMVVKSSHGKNSNGSKITGIEVIDMPRNYRMPPDQVRPNYQLLISTNDSRIRLYNFADRSMIAKFKGHENSQGLIKAVLSDTGAYAISGSEDDRTYIWRIRPESSETSKTHENYEYFHSNKSVVTVALFAPHATRRLLYESRDPIYDIADPPPVLLTRPNFANDDLPSGASSIRSASTASTANYKVNPFDGNIVITADQEGIIKVFRQDSAYERRKLHLETASNIQKKKISGLTISPTPSIATYRSNSVKATLGARNASPRTKGFPSRPNDIGSPRLGSPRLGKDNSHAHLPDMTSLHLQPPSGNRSVSPSSMSSLESYNMRHGGGGGGNRPRAQSSVHANKPYNMPAKSASTVMISATTAVVPDRGFSEPVATAPQALQQNLGDDAEAIVKCTTCGGNDFKALTSKEGAFVLVCGHCKSVQKS